jgi:hypothetical protein
MPWNVHPTVVTGQTWSAADENTYVKGNLDTLFPYTAGMQIAYSTSTSSLNKATSTAALLVVRSNSSNTAVEFGVPPVTYRRQGYSTTSWVTTSTSYSPTTYTPIDTIIQTGAVFLASSTGSIIFPSAFSAPPLVIAQMANNTAYIAGYVNTITSTGFVFSSESTLSSRQIYWVAIGQL